MTQEACGMRDDASDHQYYGAEVEEAFARELRAVGAEPWRPERNTARRSNSGILELFDIVAVHEIGTIFVSVVAQKTQPEFPAEWWGRFYDLPKTGAGVLYLRAWWSPSGWSVSQIRRWDRAHRNVWTDEEAAVKTVSDRPPLLWNTGGAPKRTLRIDSRGDVFIVARARG